MLEGVIVKAIVTGDLHLKLWSDKKYDSTGIPIKLIEILQTIEQMIVYGKSHDINTIIIAGDINDTKGVVSVRAFVLFRKLIEKYPEINWILIHVGVQPLKTSSIISPSPTPGHNVAMVELHHYASEDSQSLKLPL